MRERSQGTKGAILSRDCHCEENQSSNTDSAMKYNI